MSHWGLVNIAIRSEPANADRHIARAGSPQACSTAPPVEFGTVSVTHPSPELE